MNLGLRVLNRREDGYHHIESVFFPLELCDALEILPAASGGDGEEFRLHLSGHDVPGDPADNLCRRAWQLLKEDYPRLPAVEIWLHKGIPVGGGLGGGSSDGVSALQAMSRLFGLSLSPDQLYGYALKLGSDCPFFLQGQPCLARGRGEELQPLPLNLSDYLFVIIDPRVHIHTGEMFARLGQQRAGGRAAPSGPPLDALMHERPDRWNELLFNDFEPLVLELYPKLADIKDQLYRSGAVYASLTGTGSCFFALFEKKRGRPGIPPGPYCVYYIPSDL